VGALPRDKGIHRREDSDHALAPTDLFDQALTSDRTDAEIARVYEVHPVTLPNCKKKLKENGAKAFGGDNELKEKEKKIANLERMVGQREVEIALLKNFFGRGRRS